MKDLTFFEACGMFNVRAAVIVEHDDNILIQTMGDDYCLVGGRVKMGENSHDAIIREISEELCYTLNPNDKLSLNFVCENFFPWDNKSCHEILFIYRLILSNDSELIRRDNFKCGDNDKYIERWITFDALQKSGLLPAFVKKHIYDREFKHVLVQD